MKNIKEKEVCPTCGQEMKFLKSGKQLNKLRKTKIEEDANDEAYDISEIWHCLNCSEEWESDIKRNIWRKNEITE